MVVPLIALVIAATFFFAWGLRNRMGVEMSTRYLSWAFVNEAPGPVRYGPTWHDVVMDRLMMGRTVRDMFYRTYYRWEDTPQTARDLSAHVQDYSPQAAPVADELLTQTWPEGYGISMDRVVFPTPAGVWEKLPGDYKGRYIRDGVEWRCSQAANERELTDEFQKELDEALMGVPEASMAVAKVFQSLYLSTWPRGN